MPGNTNPKDSHMTEVRAWVDCHREHDQSERRGAPGWNPGNFTVKVGQSERVHEGGEEA